MDADNDDDGGGDDNDNDAHGDADLDDGDDDDAEGQWGLGPINGCADGAVFAEDMEIETPISFCTHHAIFNATCTACRQARLS